MNQMYIPIWGLSNLLLVGHYLCSIDKKLCIYFGMARLVLGR